MFKNYDSFFDDEFNKNNIFNDSFEDSLISNSNENKNNCEILNKNSFSLILQEEKTTNFQTNIKDDLYLYKLRQTTNNEAKNECPPFYSIEKILQTLDELKFDIDIEIKNKLIEGKESIENSLTYVRMGGLTKIKRKRESNKTKGINIIINNEKKRGRQTHNYNINYIHDKYKADNIIKKIKGKFFNSVLTFVNSILNLNEENKLLKLDYQKYINKLKRKDDINLLQKSLQDIVSLDISEKYNKEIDYNKKIINNIIEEGKKYKEKNEGNINNYKKYKTINFILSITFEDYIDLVIFKKNLYELTNDYGISISDIDFLNIKNNVKAIKEICDNIKKNYEAKYTPFFIFYLYNYKRWFYLKRERKNTSTKKKNK